MMHGRKNMKL